MYNSFNKDIQQIIDDEAEIDRLRNIQIKKAEQNMHVKILNLFGTALATFSFGPLAGLAYYKGSDLLADLLDLI